MKIIKEKNSGKYRYLTFENNMTLKIRVDVCHEYSLSEGSEVTGEKLKEAERINEYRMCLNSAYDILSRRMHSEFELRMKLKKKYWKCNVNEVMEECRRLNLLNDADFAKSYVQELKDKGKGGYVIVSSLKQKGISQELIDKYSIDGSDKEDEFQRALTVAEKKFRTLKSLPELKIKEKMIRHLLSKGFTYETVFRTVENILDR